MVGCRGLHWSCPRERNSDGPGWRSFRTRASVCTCSVRQEFFRVATRVPRGSARMRGSTPRRHVASPRPPQAHSPFTFLSQSMESGWSAPMAQRLTSCCRRRCPSSRGLIRRTSPPSLPAAINPATWLQRSVGSIWVSPPTMAANGPESAGPPAGLQINALARAVTGSRTVYAATSAGIYRSEDDGDHWVASSSGLPADAAVGPIEVTRNPMIRSPQ